MDVVTTSLEALIQRATNPQNKQPDIPAIEAFCVLVTKENEGVQIGCKLLVSCIQCQNENEALQALTLLDICMERCGPLFHAEVGKFRFLNEMIKLVSPKYLGNKTPNSIRQKVLQLLCSWTRDYPRESKIKEAYEMLKKQGVIEEDFLSIINKMDQRPSKIKNTIFEDEEKSKLLQKLLRSKNPDDLQAANRLIKTMVKEDERRLQQNFRRTMELESVHNNVKLLAEMLDSYDPNETKAEDLELMKELHQACERLKPSILRLANEVQNNEEMLADVLVASDELSQIFDKYKAVIILGLTKNSSTTGSDNSLSLLDLSSPSEHSAIRSDINININKTCNAMSSNPQSDMEVLGDIFNSLEKPMALMALDNNVLISNTTILQPIDVSSPSIKSNRDTKPVQKSSETKALEELNELESILKEGLSWTTQRSQDTSILSVNNLTKNQTVSKNDSAILLSNCESDSLPLNSFKKLCFDEKIVSNNTDSTSVTLLNGNNCLVGVSTSNENSNDKKAENIETKSITSSTFVNESKIIPLTDINISLQDIKPGPNLPITVIEEKNGISVILHFPKDSPREDVSVIVITTMNKNEKPLHNYLFQAVIPETCKCRLQPPSGTELPAHNPFLPPSAITQIMLIANPNKEPVSLKFMLSYTMNEETYTEMGEVDELPHL